MQTRLNRHLAGQKLLSIFDSAKIHFYIAKYLCGINLPKEQVSFVYIKFLYKEFTFCINFVYRGSTANMQNIIMTDIFGKFQDHLNCEQEIRDVRIT